MKKLAVFFLSASILSSVALADDSKVIATYVGGNVTESQVMQQFKAMLDMQPETKSKKFSELDKQLQEALVRSYVNIQMLEEEAKKQNIRESQEFKDRFKLVEQQMVQQVLIEKYLQQNVSDKMIDEEYSKLTKELKGQKEIKTSHILVDSEEKAKEIKQKIDKGEDFAKLAKENSKDEGSKVKGGEIGYTMKGQLVPEYEATAYALAKDQVSNPVKSQFGWHVIKLVDKRDVKVPTKQEAEAGIKQNLNNKALEKYFGTLSDNAKIEFKQ